ncbi:hypothetical protein Bca101_044021 [Brassica carinata]
MAVEDGKDSATFVVFDTDMSKLTKTESATVALDEFNGVGGPELPRCIEELAGNQYVFHISVTPFNITSNHLTFTGSAVTEDILLDPLTEARNIAKAGAFIRLQLLLINEQQIERDARLANKVLNGGRKT